MNDKTFVQRDPVEISTSALVTATGGNRVEAAMQGAAMFNDMIARMGINVWGDFAKLHPFMAPYVNIIEKATDATGHSPAVRKVL